DRVNLNAEYQQLANEISRTIESTTFNGLAILAGDAGPQAFQVGTGTAGTDSITITTEDLSEAGVFDAGDILDVIEDGEVTGNNAGAAMEAIVTLIDTITTQRATYGAAQNRFESVI